MNEISQKVLDVNCPVKHFSDAEFAEFKKDDFAFFKLVEHMQQGDNKGMGFKITFETPLLHKLFEKMLGRREWVDEIDFIEYYKKDEPVGLLAAERKFSEDYDVIKAVRKYTQYHQEINKNIRKDDTRKRKYRVLHEMIKYNDPKNSDFIMTEPIGVDLTLGNIDKLASHLSSKVNFNKEITEDSLINDVDELINAIRRSTTVNVPNINVTPDLLSNADNPFNPWSLTTLMRKVPNNAKVAGITSPHVCFSGKYSHSSYHIKDTSIASLNANFGPGKNAWIMVFEKYLPHVIKAIKKEFKGESSDGKGFIRSKAYLLTCEWFRAKGIPFRITIQQPGDIIITPANCLHFVICLSRCFKETVNFTDPRWFSLNCDDYYICLGDHKSKSFKQPWSHGPFPRPTDEQFNSEELLSLWGVYVAQVRNTQQATNKKITVELDTPVASSSYSFSSSFSSTSHTNKNSKKNEDNINELDIVSSQPEVSESVTVRSVKKRARKLCSVCYKSFCDNRRLHGHFLRKHAGQPLPVLPTSNKPKTKLCHICSKGFHDPSSLIRHIKNIHSPADVPQKKKKSNATSSTFKCTLCDKFYATNGTLQRHMNTIHA